MLMNLNEENLKLDDELHHDFEKMDRESKIVSKSNEGLSGEKISLFRKYQVQLRSSHISMYQ